MLIVFEGIDGCGKNTQVKKVLAFLKQHKVKYKLHKYPTRKAKEVFAHLSGKKTIEPMNLADIFAQDIIDEREKIEEEMEEGFVVICDRYLQSTLAYQGVNVGFEKLYARLEKSNGIVPDLVVLMDVDAKTSAKRKSAQKVPDRFEKDLAYLAKVRANYLKMMKREFYSYKYGLVDARRPVDEVFTDVVSLVEPLVVKKMKA